MGFRDYSAARVVLISPIPVVPDMLRRVPDYVRQHQRWDNTDLYACADTLRSVAFQHGVPMVDLMEAFGAEPDPNLYFLDGLHAGPAGQELILRHVLEAV